MLETLRRFNRNQTTQESHSPYIIGVGTSLTPEKYTQQDILNIFDVRDPRICALFLNSAIQSRHLTLPPCDSYGKRRMETQGELLKKHTNIGLKLGSEAISRCLEQVNAKVTDIRHLCCVTSTGFLTPGFSALLLQACGLNTDCSRLDVVGMGCNAGLNALSMVSAWAHAHPTELALVVCIEICSAAYVFDGTMRTAVVNSLFGDGAAAVAIRAMPKDYFNVNEPLKPIICRFSSFMIPDAMHAMGYEWDDSHGKFSFFLDPNVPYVIGAHAERALAQLLQGTGLCSADIQHWVVHSGGKKVVDAVRINLGLTRYDVRHTIGVLRDCGNLSSGSFLFSYQRFLNEDKINPGEYGVIMTMGPGATIEMALLYWQKNA